MARNLKGLGIVLLFLIMLVSPKAVFAGASEGLLLWFQIILPTLFPFLLVTNLLLVTGNMHLINAAFGSFLTRFFGVSPNGSFAVVTGFLCGYPMGAKTAADLSESGYISAEEGRYLLSFCNNSSPVFILNYVVWKTLETDALLIPTLLILMLSPVLVSFFTRTCFLHKKHGFQNLKKNGFSKSAWSFQDIDRCIMDSFETLVKVGGYIILFSVFLSLFGSLPVDIPGISALLPLLEVTNGLVLLREMHLPLHNLYPAVLGLTSFGGFCAAAQTQCMVHKAGFPILPYLTQKLAAALTASLMGSLYLYIVG